MQPHAERKHKGRGNILCGDGVYRRAFGQVMNRNGEHGHRADMGRALFALLGMMVVGQQAVHEHQSHCTHCHQAQRYRQRQFLGSLHNLGNQVERRNQGKRPEGDGNGILLDGMHAAGTPRHHCTKQEERTCQKRYRKRQGVTAPFLPIREHHPD
ncbi:MAG: hypothetical protein E7000_07385 [Coriobacteriaceae bacterium]|nr:hypothetical protein [Coriobacteriaceae bacterium]